MSAHKLYKGSKSEQEVALPDYNNCITVDGYDRSYMPTSEYAKPMFSGFLKSRLSGYFCVLFVFQELSLARALVPADESTLRLYYRPDATFFSTYQLSDATDILNDPHFNLGKETHMYFHGYNESQDSESVRVIVAAYLQTELNIITLDWAKAAKGSYPETIASAQLLSTVLADVIIKLYDAGLDSKDLTVVGHSLGSQLGGMTARNMKLKSNGIARIDRMAGLDPAYPGFPPLVTVNRNDAGFLQVIHTGGGTFGQPFSIGHVDIFPNGGRPIQPGCPQGIFIPLSKNDLCNHQRSWRFYAESIPKKDNSGQIFLAFPSSSYIQFLAAGKENLKNEPIEMGLYCSTSARGNYYLTTNSQSPFAKGWDGYKF